MTSRRALAALLAGALLVPGVAAAPVAAAGCPRASLPDVESQVMCVSCGVPLNLAESPQADGERRLIRELIARCQSSAQIRAALRSEYGPNVLALPSGGGFSLAVWIVPAGAALLGAGAIGLLAGRWRRRPPTPATSSWTGTEADGSPGPSAGPSDAEEHRLDDDLARFR